MAENKAALSEAEGGLEDESKLQELALAKWKGLSKDEKESYKSPRIPNSGQKRKREEGQNSVSKLAKFAANAWTPTYSHYNFSNIYNKHDAIEMYYSRHDFFVFQL